MQIGKSWFLLLLVLTPLLMKSGMFVDYLARYSYYAEVLCENRDKPEMECNGKCALMKNLQEAEPDADSSKPLLPGFANLKEFPAEPATCDALRIPNATNHPALGSPKNSGERIQGYTRIPEHPPAV